MSEKPIREYDRFILRLPDGMRESLSARAKASGRSMNAEIVSILSSQINEPDDGRMKELEDLIRDLERRDRVLHEHIAELAIQREAAREELMRRKMVKQVRARRSAEQ